MKRIARMMVAVVAGIALLHMGAGAAHATGSLAISNAALTGPAPTVLVSWSGIKPNDIVVVSQCGRSDSEPGFSQATDCSQATAQTFRSGEEGAGSGTFEVFIGAEPNGESWSCGAGPVAANGSGFCFIRLAVNTINDTDSDLFVQFNLSPKSSAGSISWLGFAGVSFILLALIVPAAFAVIRRRRVQEN